MSETEDQAREFIGRVDARLVLAHKFNIEKFSETLFDLVDEIATRDGRIAELERENAELGREIDRFRAGAKDSVDHYADACAEIDRLNAQWERLTSEEAVNAACAAHFGEGWSMSVWRERNRLKIHTAIEAARDAARGEG
jgi:hypothetical protein